MRPFRVNVYAAPREGLVPQRIVLRDLTIESLRFDSGLLSEFSQTFDGALDALSRATDALVEPDGSFAVARGRESQGRLEGSLFERAGRLFYVYLAGECNATLLRDTLACFGWPNERLIFEQMEWGVYLSEKEFERLFCSN